MLNKSFNNWIKKCHEFFCVKKISFENGIFVATQWQLLFIYSASSHARIEVVMCYLYKSYHSSKNYICSEERS